MTPGVVRPVVVMVMGSLAPWLLARLVFGPGSSREILLGMLAPLVVAVVSWVAVVRAFRARPAGVMGVMVVAFGAKMLVFGVYVAFVLRGLELRPVPFVVSFTTYFIGLHLAEALWLRRLFAEGASGVR